MKLDAYILRTAVIERDREAILDCFQERFSAISKYRSGSWLMLCAPWVGAIDGAIAVRADNLAYCWIPTTGLFEEKLFHLSPQFPSIHIHPGLWNLKPE